MDLLSVIFPKRCLNCRQIGSYLCPDCVNKIHPLNHLNCPVCKRPSLEGFTHSSCLSPHSLNGLISIFPYYGLVKKIVTKFKYSFFYDLTQTLIDLIISHVDHPILYQDPFTLIPIPLHPQRLKWRGFNQAKLLAKGLNQSWHLPLNTNFLIRTQNTPPQMNLSRKKRLTNLTQAFALTPKSIIPSYRILLIDDVATTNATLSACAAVIKKTYPQTIVWGLTFAQTMQE